MALMMLESEGEEPDEEAKLISPQNPKMSAHHLSSVIESSCEESTHREVRPFNTPSHDVS